MAVLKTLSMLAKGKLQRFRPRLFTCVLELDSVVMCPLNALFQFSMQSTY